MTQFAPTGQKFSDLLKMGQRQKTLDKAYNFLPLKEADRQVVGKPSQTFQDFEAIVVNDGSPDTPELEKVLQPYMERIVYIVQPNKRAAGARNTAIQRARGEFLAY